MICGAMIENAGRGSREIGGVHGTYLQGYWCSREVGGVYGRYLQGYWGSREILAVLKLRSFEGSSWVKELNAPPLVEKLPNGRKPHR